MRISDWSSDVCSSDLLRRQRPAADGRARPESRRCRVRDQRGAEIQGPPDQHHRQRGIFRRQAAQADGDQGSAPADDPEFERSDEHTSELQPLMRISYAVLCLQKKIDTTSQIDNTLRMYIKS